MSSRGASNSSVSAGSRNGWMPDPTACGASPKTSKTQISPQRSGSSSRPTIHTDAIERGLRSIRARTSRRPYRGVHPHCAGWNSRTVSPSRNGCCPRVLPTSSEYTPDWMPDTRSGA